MPCEERWSTTKNGRVSRGLRRTALAWLACARGEVVVEIGPHGRHGGSPVRAPDGKVVIDVGVDFQGDDAFAQAAVLCYGFAGAAQVCLPLADAGVELPPLVLDDARQTACVQHDLVATVRAADGSTAAAAPTTVWVGNGAVTTAHAARERRWRHDLETAADEGGALSFVEIGTSFFDTLAHEYYGDACWGGLSVEPVAEYLARLPAREGFRREAALVCPDGAGPEGELWVMDEAAAARFGGYALLGMSTTDAQYVADAKRRLGDGAEFFRPRAVPCATYAQLMGAHGVSQIHHLKVDAEGADVEIVRAALDFARQACAWPWRIDFEVHDHQGHVLDLLENLEDAGYACQCFTADCFCYATQTRLDALHRGCLPASAPGPPA
ncbi:hypothetical protein M885DRAFT_511059 [Pelagophyceae sp. CCMP2097]|nr:hypothetical protein M885DRAFT_511059 [Pelagophyceae sp. CCMP2097]|mmetsp:Transcript_13539/g.48123  ORF Transcript_13539/g.48123 Transcript_13539/m.48123 type:complete len:382 (+) Transcript_13539:96-1241(+)